MDDVDGACYPPRRGNPAARVVPEVGARNPPRRANPAARVYQLRDPAADMGEPIDLFANMAPEPVLTRDMLPATVAIEYAFDVAERQGVDPAITVSAFLAVCAAAIHDGIKIQRKVSDTEHVERAHVSILIVAPPGGGKTPAISAMVTPLKAIEDQWRIDDARQIGTHDIAMKIYAVQEKEYLAKFKTITKIGDGPLVPDADAPVLPVKPIERRIIANDVTIEGLQDVLKDNPRGVLNVQDEVTGWLASFDAYRNGRTGKDRAFWLQTDQGGSYSVDRAGRRFYVPNLSACFIGGIQPGKLREVATDLATDGFIQRAYVVNVGTDQHDEQDHPANSDARAAYERLLRGLLALEPATPAQPITLDWEAHYHREEVEKIADALIRMPTTPDALRQHLAKWKGKYCRLLLLYHAIECISQGEKLASEVMPKTAECARKFMVEFVLPHAMRFYAEFFKDADVTGTDARWIAGHILAHQLTQITARDIKRVYIDSEYRLNAAMTTLEEARWVGPKLEGAKRSVSWRVNPRVHVIYTERARTEKTRRQAAQNAIIEAAATLRRAGLQ